MNEIKPIDHVSDMDGMLALSGPLSGSKAFTIGHYSIGPRGYVADWRDHLFVHEYGHYIQSQRFGISYLPVIAIPSLMSTIATSGWAGMKHYQRWFEVDASNLGAKHFDKKYGAGKANNLNGEDYFDINAFKTNTTTKYKNPRDGGYNQNIHPISGSHTTFWDFIIF